MTTAIRNIPVPCVTTGLMREVDRIATEEYRLHLLQMMENAGRPLAHLAREQFLDGRTEGQSVLGVCGTGGNGAAGSWPRVGCTDGVPP